MILSTLLVNFLAWFARSTENSRMVMFTCQKQILFTSRANSVEKGMLPNKK
uniref:Uncharacterized protein n=1 Tax=Anguilla anguilla TaxID=7936 RepID=A0A0E9QD19_ANGAN